jgi:hypothetical protein
MTHYLRAYATLDGLIFKKGFETRYSLGSTVKSSTTVS